MSKRFGFMAAAVTASTLVAPSMMLAAVPDFPDPARSAVNGWAGQILSATLAGEVLKQMGYNVEPAITGAPPQLAAIATDEFGMNPGIWHNSVACEDIEVTGPLGPNPCKGWIYPPDMKGRCWRNSRARLPPKSRS